MNRKKKKRKKKSGSTRLSIFIPQNSHYSSNVVDDVLIILFFHEMSCSFQQTFMEESPLSFSYSRYQKKKKSSMLQLDAIVHYF